MGIKMLTRLAQPKRKFFFFLHQMLMVSDEAEFIQDFTLELFSLRRKLKGED